LLGAPSEWRSQGRAATGRGSESSSTDGWLMGAV
jgi:hypothetical protein